MPYSTKNLGIIKSVKVCRFETFFMAENLYTLDVSVYISDLDVSVYMLKFVLLGYSALENEFKRCVDLSRHSNASGITHER